MKWKSLLLFLALVSILGLAAVAGVGCKHSSSTGECAPGCPDDYIGDNYCDQACNVAACNYDDGDCSSAQTSETQCAPGCPDYYIGDGYCDDECNVAACNYDGGDCEGSQNDETLCAPGCPDYYIGDNYCDQVCNVAACNYDGGDCEGSQNDETLCAPDCQDYYIGDGYCDDECNVAACNYDGGDCSGAQTGETQCAPGCPDYYIGDNHCDQACNVSACNYDSGDCGALSTDEVVQYFSDQLERLSNGESADLDGDGYKEMSVSTDAQGRTVWETTYETFVEYSSDYEYTRVYDPVLDSEIVTINIDYSPWIQTTTTENQRVILEDTDNDFIYDWRQQDDYNWPENTKRTTISTAHTANGDFQTISDVTVSLTEYKCGKKMTSAERAALNASQTNPVCKPVYPSGGVDIKLAGKDIGIYTNYADKDGADGSCSLAHSEKIEKAYDCAVAQNTGCLQNTNKAEFLRLTDALANNHLHISCGTSSACSTDQGSNQPRDGEHSDISWNPRFLDSMTDDALCSAMLHEMMHFAGTPDASDKTGYNHNDGVDRVYACSRYCGGSDGCTYDNNFPGDCGITMAKDCAVCAGTPDEKYQCGYKERKARWCCCCDKSCDNGQVAAPCESIGGVDVYSCDNVRLWSDGCCEKCPAAYPHQYCSECSQDQLDAAKSLENTCNDMPPECRR